MLTKKPPVHTKQLTIFVNFKLCCQIVYIRSISRLYIYFFYNTVLAGRQFPKQRFPTGLQNCCFSSRKTIGNLFPYSVYQFIYPMSRSLLPLLNAKPFTCLKFTVTSINNFNISLIIFIFDHYHSHIRQSIHWSFVERHCH